MIALLITFGFLFGLLGNAAAWWYEHDRDTYGDSFVDSLKRNYFPD